MLKIYEHAYGPFETVDSTNGGCRGEDHSTTGLVKPFASYNGCLGFVWSMGTKSRCSYIPRELRSVLGPLTMFTVLNFRQSIRRLSRLYSTTRTMSITPAASAAANS